MYGRTHAGESSTLWVERSGQLSVSMSEVMLNQSRPALPRPSAVPLLGLAAMSSVTTNGNPHPNLNPNPNPNPIPM